MNNEEKILEILTQMQAAQTQTNDRLAKLEADVSGIKVRLDVDIQNQIDRLVDGQDMLYRKVTHVEGLAEETKEKVDVIHAVVAQHSRDIIELKKVK